MLSSGVDHDWFFVYGTAVRPCTDLFEMSQIRNFRGLLLLLCLTRRVYNQSQVWSLFPVVVTGSRAPDGVHQLFK